MRLDSIANRGDYFSAHYLAEVLPKDLKRKDGLLARWTETEKDPEAHTPRRGLRKLNQPYFAERKFFADFDERRREADSVPADWPEVRDRLSELHGMILEALGYEGEARDLTVRRSDDDYTVRVAYADEHVVAIECGWAVDVDAALDGRLLRPVQVGTNEKDVIEDGTKLASWILTADEPPRYVLILAGGVIVLADRAAWGEGRYLGVSIDVALGRNDLAELGVIGALFGADSLLPPAEGGDEPLAELLTNSRNHAVGVSKDLRDGLKDSVELIANEVLARMRDQGVEPEDVMEPRELADQLGRESLRYLYRILFLLYAEARPELGIVPTKDQDYVRGYSLARLGDLVVRDLVSEQSRTGFHLYESLNLLFRMVNDGHRVRNGDDDESDGEGLRFEPLRSKLFEPESIKLIGSVSVDDDERPIDTRLRDATLHNVLRRLMLTKGRRKERGGFISYAQLGINQLGAVYEGLMSYTGFIAQEDLYEVAKNGDPKDGSWMIPASKVDDYPQDVFVLRTDDNPYRDEDEFVRYPKGAFVYRLAGRDRETSASYYTPESLTQVTVQLALKHRLDQDGTTTEAREILGWKICEPALGSGAFLNEAINQVAAEYLKRRQKELGRTIDPEQYEVELQKAKAYIALHNSYGVDLNDTAIELAEVSLWLNVMHPGLQAPWFGLHLRRGNSLIGAGRKVYRPDQLTKGTWLKEAPDEVPFRDGAIPDGHVHHFLLPAEGWGAVAGAKEAKNLAPEQAKQLGAWRKKMKAKVSDKKKARKPSQLHRLQSLSRRAEYLWELVMERLTISEREISRKIGVWGADWIDQPENAVPKEKVYDDLTAPGTPYWRLKTVMDAWCALWFWPLDKAGLLDGTADAYGTASAELEPVSSMPLDDEDEQFRSFDTLDAPKTYKTQSLFSLGTEQLDLTDAALTETQVATSTGKWKRTKGRKPKLDEVRRVIPLNNLDDWLDFAEALLGRADVPPDSLAHHFSGLAELSEYEDHLPGWTGMDDVHSHLNQRFPWLSAVKEISENRNFFHWELMFAQTFQKGGFDLQVGNPPWVRPRWDEAGVLAEHNPWFKLSDKPSMERWRLIKAELLAGESTRLYFLGESATNTGNVEFLSSPTTYPLLTGTQPDLYRGFMSRCWSNLGHRGTASLVHPDTHFAGVKEGRLRAAAYRHLHMHGHFMNSRILFDGEHRLEFGVHIYGLPRQAISFAHVCWLFEPATMKESLEHDGDGELPGIRHDGRWDLRPHRGRLIQVDEQLLEQWRHLTSSNDLEIEQSPLLYPVTTSEAGAIEALSKYARRLGDGHPRISRGYDEANAKKDGLIRWETSKPTSLNSVILQGPHFAQATPFNKQPNIPCRNKNDYITWNLTNLPENAVPVTNYVQAGRSAHYLAAQDIWKSHDGAERRYTEFYRLAWRYMVPLANERSLFAALIPPGPAHINSVHTLAMPNNRDTVLAAGFWAALPLDYLLRVTGRAHVQVGDAPKMPAADPNHPLTSALLLRTLRLNCLTDAYADIWKELYDPNWMDEEWAVAWPDIRGLNDVSSITREWSFDTPLRSERERRAALVELDAMVALWLGVTADQLGAIYRSRYPVLSAYEGNMWFDANGRKIAKDHHTFGYGQTKEHFKQLQEHLDPEINGPVPDGYTAPFYKADREAEYRQAHAVFAERLRASGWEGETAS
ncbi:class I SAM-dependent DNA methyltransferase [Actinomadura sp. WMMB 499]|uniref:Eco57I restriction-modification methylase domain-containing protein n=1 Tax=Actinomadura sp. WMMB 499 TaxID=1219491 RepID=UPI0012484931|nr:class I SAM-dependent DNA methyltransferase [Actinomadura sp. WMMB 499]QFG27138.1 class I SAM-dependent DNA methyltransferase [Actinomadura sp. WMMB 499]